MNKYIIGENSSGKTRRMLEEAKKNNAIVICKNPMHMHDKANNYGIYGLKFIGYNEVNKDSVFNEKISIDEIGDFFKHYFKTDLDSFTMTIE